MTRQPPDIDALMRTAASTTLSSGVSRASTGATRVKSAVAGAFRLPCNCFSATAAKASGMGFLDINSSGRMEPEVGNTPPHFASKDFLPILSSS